MGARLQLIGRRFGLLTVVTSVYTTTGAPAWECKCDCGGVSVVTSGRLTSGNTKSCGCRKRAVLGESTTKHGHSRKAGLTRTYRIWRGMKTRCENTKSAVYARYGGRGITVCERWQRYENFVADMGECPDGLTLDRIDNNGGYEPGNCRWASYKDQSRNQRTNRNITWKGRTMCLSAWAELVDKDASWLWKRLKRKSLPEAMSPFETVFFEVE